MRHGLQTKHRLSRVYRYEPSLAGQSYAPRGRFCLLGPAARCISHYRRWPKPTPMYNAFCRSAPTVRFVSFDILSTGVLAFECAFSSFRSALVHSRRLPFFLATLAFFNSIAPIDEGRC